MKNKFIDKAKSNWVKTQQDPFANAKFNHKVTKVFAYFIMIIISLTFVNLIYKQFKNPSAYSLLIGGFMVLVLGYLLFNIYSKVLLPQKKILDHYENVPTPISSNYIDVEKEVDDILDSFDKKGNRK